MRVIQLCGVNLAKPSLPAVECQYQTIAWLSANPASANFRFGVGSGYSLKPPEMMPVHKSGHQLF
jgi:hypothetical protein